MRKHAMKNFTVDLTEFVVVFGSSLASAAMLISILIGVLNLNVAPATDLGGHITMPYQIRE
jgi:membrane-associated protease RseP (regulator of RpoE activity)